MATIGAVCGAIVINIISYNRKWLFCICLMVSMLGGLLLLIANSYSTVLAGMFIGGFGSN